MNLPPPELSSQEVLTQYVAHLLLLALAVAGAILGAEKLLGKPTRRRPPK